MKYRIRLTDEDYLRYRIAHFRHSKSGKRQVYQARKRIVRDCILFILIFILMGAQRDLLLIFSIGLSIMSVVMYIKTPTILERAIQKQVNELKMDGKLPYHADSEVEFMESMVVHRSAQGEMYLNYSDIENIIFDQDYIFIYWNATQAIAIPYYCLGADQERVIQFLRGVTHHGS